MNKQEGDVLNTIFGSSYTNQRVLAELSGHSLGAVNRSIKNLIKDGYLDEQIKLTKKAHKELRDKAPKNAVILAAGFGMRMIPINMELPKALLEVKGERLIERIIRQLHEVGIREIYVVVGFMKEKFEYLLDEYGVELIVNSDFAKKNNLHSLKHALSHLSNTYIIPCDIWCRENPFCSHELYSWYMVSDALDSESSVYVNRKKELVSTKGKIGGNAMIGISYLLEEQAAIIRKRIDEFSNDMRYNNSFWEEALYNQKRMIVYARVVHAADVVEINTYEQLRKMDSSSNQLKSDAIDIITKTFHVKQDEVFDIIALKKGMTNQSFLFKCREKKYIMRIPGEGTSQLINRVQEADVYRVIRDKQICDNVIYINPDNGYKITEYIENARVCDPMNVEDVAKCMSMLRKFHELELHVEHEFDIFKQIDFYESLWNGLPSVYKDYNETKKKIFSLQEYINQYVDKKVLTHIDAVPDNFLLIQDGEKTESIRLIDWEYAGMQDPHVDIAMFCIYSLYNRQQVDQLIQDYFVEGCPNEIRIKIYCYIAVCGLLWSNWCEYKRNLGVEFGEYSLRQYRYAKDYYRYVLEELEKRENNVPC